jgi:hypothetical protein
MLSVSVETLIEWSKSLGGSRVIESFLNNKGSLEIKTKFIKRMEGHFAEVFFFSIFVGDVGHICFYDYLFGHLVIFAFTSQL